MPDPGPRRYQTGSPMRGEGGAEQVCVNLLCVCVMWLLDSAHIFFCTVQGAEGGRKRKRSQAESEDEAPEVKPTRPPSTRIRKPKRKFDEMDDSDSNDEAEGGAPASRRTSSASGIEKPGTGAAAAGTSTGARVDHTFP